MLSSYRECENRRNEHCAYFIDCIYLCFLSLRFCADPAQPGGLVGPFTARDIAKKFDDGALDGLSLLFQQVLVECCTILSSLRLMIVLFYTNPFPYVLYIYDSIYRRHNVLDCNVLSSLQP